MYKAQLQQAEREKEALQQEVAGCKEFAQTACVVHMNTQDASVYKVRLQQAEREKEALQKQLAEADAGLAREVAEKLRLQEQGPRAQVSFVSV